MTEYSPTERHSSNESAHRTGRHRVQRTVAAISMLLVTCGLLGSTAACEGSSNNTPAASESYAPENKAQPSSAGCIDKLLEIHRLDVNLEALGVEINQLTSDDANYPERLETWQDTQSQLLEQRNVYNNAGCSPYLPPGIIRPTPLPKAAASNGYEYPGSTEKPDYTTECRKMHDSAKEYSGQAEYYNAQIDLTDDLSQTSLYAERRQEYESKRNALVAPYNAYDCPSITGPLPDYGY